MLIEAYEDEFFPFKASTPIVAVETKDEIVGYIGNKPLTRADLIKQAFEAEEDLKAGRVYTVDEVRIRYLSKANS